VQTADIRRYPQMGADGKDSEDAGARFRKKERPKTRDLSAPICVYLRFKKL
jgi:hypothetical protein